ncbi:DUF4386 domain-containing protein [Maribellus maritimus]|uniref:DUF4386 domain-containing protein n=1 Tax=Maribellus maritimus TaxID=2870838 RepID=UPI001EEC59F7|nr:DUF4386 domain-containing protein [Maribellus maritimus]MCG6186925.1 DUF4386 domain-containing protein [Maribellus maritimus]
MITNRKSALIAGIALIFMAAVAVFIYGYIHNMLLVPGNPEATAVNLESHRWLFHTEILGWHVILLLDVVVAWALYILFKNENRKLSAFAAGLRFVYSAILGVAILNFIYILKILNGSFAMTQQMANEQIMSFLQSFERTLSFGLIIFGFHLLILGFLALKSKYILRFWGILLIFAAISYIIIHSAKFFLPEFESQIKFVENVLSLPMAFGEIGFAFWLIFRGGKPVMDYKPGNELTPQS